MPSGAAAHNAAHCEPIPGDWPEPAPQLAPPDAVSPDEPLDAIHAMGAAHGDSQSGEDGVPDTHWAVLAGLCVPATRLAEWALPPRSVSV